MQSKRSFFNVTLFKKHLSRFWPLWGGISLVGAMFPLYAQLVMMQDGRRAIPNAMAFREGLYQISAIFVPAFVCAYAILCVMAVWGYLYNARSVGLMHTLPVDRTCLFATNTLAALVMVLIPFAVTGGLLCLLAMGWGFFDLLGVVNTVLMVLFCTLLFVGIGTLCAMLTGHGFVLPAFYLLVNFLACLLELLVTSLASEFLIGVPWSEDIGRLEALSPIIRIYRSVRVYGERQPDGSTVYHLQGLWVAAVYALAGLALLALAWFLYRKRHSESAGDVVAFRWLRPVFQYGAALLSALTVGRLLYELMWQEIFGRGLYGDALPMAVCLFLAGLLGYYAAAMLLEKTLKVFRRQSLPGVAIVAAGAVAVCLLVSVDLFGVERRVPDFDEIESVSIMDRGFESGPWYAGDNPDQAEALRSFHQALVDDRNYLRTYSPDWRAEGDDVVSHYILLEYTLKDGSTLRREYDPWLTRSRVNTAGTYDNLLAAFYQDPAVRAETVQIPGGTELNGISMHCDYTEDYYTWIGGRLEEGSLDARRVYDALQKDAAEGNIPTRDVMESSFTWHNNYNFYLDLEYLLFDDFDNVRYGRDRTVFLYPTMTNTLDTLLDLGYITHEEIANWEKAIEDMRAEAEGEAAAWAEQSMVLPEENTVPAG